MAAAVATVIARAFTILKGGPDATWTAEHIAGITGLEVDQVMRACSRLVKSKRATIAGVSCNGSALYQIAEGAEKPGDGRGKHRHHLKGAQWANRRKRRANLVKARAARQRREGAVVLGVKLGADP